MPKDESTANVERWIGGMKKLRGTAVWTEDGQTRSAKYRSSAVRANWGKALRGGPRDA
jgi:hypothetical protein